MSCSPILPNLRNLDDLEFFSLELTDVLSRHLSAYPVEHTISLREAMNVCIQYAILPATTPGFISQTEWREGRFLLALITAVRLEGRLSEWLPLLDEKSLETARRVDIRFMLPLESQTMDLANELPELRVDLDSPLEVVESEEDPTALMKRMKTAVNSYLYHGTEDRRLKALVLVRQLESQLMA